MQNGTSKPERDAHGWGRRRCQPPGSGGNGSSLERVVAELNFQGGVTQSRTQRLQRPRGVTEGVWLARLGRSLERDAAGSSTERGWRARARNRRLAHVGPVSGSPSRMPTLGHHCTSCFSSVTMLAGSMLSRPVSWFGINVPSMSSLSAR